MNNINSSKCICKYGTSCWWFISIVCSLCSTLGIVYFSLHEDQYTKNQFIVNIIMCSFVLTLSIVFGLLFLIRGLCEDPQSYYNSFCCLCENELPSIENSDPIVLLV